VKIEFPWNNDAYDRHDLSKEDKVIRFYGQISHGLK
jgi:hypothetical protein